MTFRCLNIFIVCIALFTSCSKYLDKKAQKQQFIPSEIEDLQALLDNIAINTNGPALLEILADDYYITTAAWENIMNSAPDLSQNYIWAKDAIPNRNSWVFPYQQPIYISNIVLDHLPGIKATEKKKIDNIRGSALFYRAYTFFQLAQIYCKPYSTDNLNEPGIVLRNTSDISESTVRANIQETYDKIISDIKEAMGLLPTTSLYPTRPTVSAATGFLARVYLSMRDYANALKYSNECLSLKDDLLDFNELIPVQSPPIRTFNKEVIYHSIISSASILSTSNAKIDSTLIESYNQSDLRKVVFFRPNTGSNVGTYSFRGSYHGNGGVGTIFNGITTSEMFLIRAECNVRVGQIENALSDLNSLLKKRWLNDGSFIPFQSTIANDILEKILLERRHELVFRGLRWSDLRRLNLEGRNISLTRIINGRTYSLPPNDLRWVALIPFEVISKSGIPQNPR